MNDNDIYKDILSLCSWPLILDLDGRAIAWIRALNKDRGGVRIIQENNANNDYLTTLKMSISAGEAVILYDEACCYDSRLNSLYKKNTFTRDEENGGEELVVEVDGEYIPYSPNFRLYILTRGIPPIELQTQCSFVNYGFTSNSLNEFFLDTVFEKEKPAKRQEYILICTREIEAMTASRRHRDRIQSLLTETEGSILDNANLSSQLLELRKELNKSDDRAVGMRDMKRELKNVSKMYTSAAVHATVLYQTIQQLKRICHMYQYSFEWFSRVFRLSIENSNKSNSIEKRLRYLKDHFTYSLFCQISYSLQQKDRLIFAFLLCSRLLISENKIQAAALNKLVRYKKEIIFQREN